MIKHVNCNRLFHDLLILEFC